MDYIGHNYVGYSNRYEVERDFVVVSSSGVLFISTTLMIMVSAIYSISQRKLPDFHVDALVYVLNGCLNISQPCKGKVQIIVIIFVGIFETKPLH